MDALASLAKTLAKIPGMGIKTTTRIAYFLLNSDASYNLQLAHEIETLQSKIKPCSVCGRFTETDPCPICSDPGRNRKVICVVEDARDVQNLESTGQFDGLYHVLGGVLSPMDGVGPEQLRIRELLERIQSEGCTEVIVATNPTVEGDIMASYLAKMLSDFPVRVSRLASGLPVGGDLEYADRLTLSRSLRGRITVSDPNGA